MSISKQGLASLIRLITGIKKASKISKKVIIREIILSKKVLLYIIIISKIY